MSQVIRICGVCALLVPLMACGAAISGTTAGGTPTAPAAPAAKATAEADAAALADFTRRLDAYITLQRRLAQDAPSLGETKDPATIAAAEKGLADRLREARRDARQGDIFTPQVVSLFRRLMSPELEGAEGRETKANARDEWANVRPRVNADYPPSQPLPTVPPNILANLPQLPDDVEYRLVGRDLILRDVDANIIVDFIPDAIRS